jgi:TP901 family phage tail tape measure protein
VPELGKATYVLTLSTALYKGELAAAEAETEATTAAIQKEFERASKSVNTLGVSMGVTAGEVTAASTEIQGEMAATGDAALAMGTKSEAAGARTMSVFTRMKTEGASLVSAGKTWSRAFLPLYAALGVGAKMAIDFQSQMLLIQTQAGGTARDVKILSQQVLDLAKVMPQGPNELARGLYHAFSLMHDSTMAMRVLKAAANGAMVGMSDLESTVSALGGAVRTGIPGTENYAQAMATLNGIVGAGNMRMEDLVAALGTGVLPTAKLAGLTLREVGAALATMTDENIPATQAMTRFKTALMLMQAGSKQADKALGEIGLSGSILGFVTRSQGFGAALDLILQRLKRLHDSKQVLDLANSFKQGQISMDQFIATAQKTASFQLLSKAFGGARGAATIMLLLNNLGVYNQKLGQIDQSSATYAQSIIDSHKSMRNQLKTAWSSIEVALIDLGNTVAPVLVSLAGAAAKVADAFTKLPGPVRNGIAVMALFLGAIGPVMVISGKVMRALALLGGGFRGVGTAAEEGAATTTAATATIEAEAATAGGAVAGLRTKLLAMNGLRVVATIVIAYEILKALKDELNGPPGSGSGWQDFHAGKHGEAKQGGVGQLINALTGGHFGGKKGGFLGLDHVPGLNKIFGKGGGNKTKELSYNDKVGYIAWAAQKLGIDPKAALAVAYAEGGFSGKIGDSGHAYGPFQLNNAGGVITKMYPGKMSAAAQAFANSAQGIWWALSQMKSARGLDTDAAIKAIIGNFERPGDLKAGKNASAQARMYAATSTGDYARAMEFLGTGGVYVPPTPAPHVPDAGKGGKGGGKINPKKWRENKTWIALQTAEANAETSGSKARQLQALQAEMAFLNQLHFKGAAGLDVAQERASVKSQLDSLTKVAKPSKTKIAKGWMEAKPWVILEGQLSMADAGGHKVQEKALLHKEITYLTKLLMGTKEGTQKWLALTEEKASKISMLKSLDPKKSGKGSKSLAKILGPTWTRAKINEHNAAMTAGLKDDIRAMKAEEDILTKKIKAEKGHNDILEKLTAERARVHKKRLALEKKAANELTATQKQLVEIQAAMDLRGSFFAEFASSIFHQTPQGLALGASAVTVSPSESNKSAVFNTTNHYNEIPRDRHMVERGMSRAARAVFG